jgi:hypothetical protein
MNKNKLLEFFSKVLNDQKFKNENIKDPHLARKIKSFLSKKISLERQKYIDGLREFGFSGDDDLWDQYTLEELKKEYKLVVKN